MSNPIFKVGDKTTSAAGWVYLVTYVDKDSYSFRIYQSEQTDKVGNTFRLSIPTAEGAMRRLTKLELAMK